MTLHAGTTLLAACIAALGVADEALKQLMKAAEKGEKLIKRLDQQESLAFLCNPIQDFRISIACETGFNGWVESAHRLQFEQIPKKRQKPSRVQEDALKKVNVSIKKTKIMVMKLLLLALLQFDDGIKAKILTQSFYHSL